jgi:hypothetical protein
MRTVANTVNIQIEKTSTLADVSGHMRTLFTRSSKPVIVINSPGGDRSPRLAHRRPEFGIKCVEERDLFGYM